VREPDYGTHAAVALRCNATGLASICLEAAAQDSRQETVLCHGQQQCGAHMDLFRITVHLAVTPGFNLHACINISLAAQ
jgi:hypothetical protein